MRLFYVLEEGLAVPCETGAGLDTVSSLQHAVKLLVESKEVSACEPNDIEVYGAGTTCDDFKDKTPLDPNDKLPMDTSADHAVFVHVPGHTSATDFRRISMAVVPTSETKTTRPRRASLPLVVESSKTKALPDYMKRKFFVKYGPQTIQVLMDPEDIFGNLKAELETATGVPRGEQKFYYNGMPKAFADDKSLRHYGLQGGGFFKLERTPVAAKPERRRRATFVGQATTTDMDISDKMERRRSLVSEAEAAASKNAKRKLEVEMPNGTVVPLTLNASDTVNDIKEAIEEDCDIPAAQQVLKCNGKILKDNSKSLEESEIPDGARLTVESFQIPVTVNDTTNGQQISLNIDPTEPISSNLQQLLEKKTGIPVNNQCLSMNGKEISDLDNSAKDHGIKAGSILDLEPKTIQLQVKTPKGDTISLQVKPSDTVHAIKELLVAETGLSVHQQVLSLNGKELSNDAATLKELGVKEGTVLDLDIFKLPITVMNGNTEIQMMIDPTKPIAEIQQRLEEDTGMSIDNQCLSMNGEPLTDATKTAADYGMDAGSILELEPKVIEVQVKTPEGNTVTVQVKPSDTTELLKEKLAAETGLSVPLQVLSLDGNEMPNDGTMKDLGVKNGSVLDLAVAKISITVNNTVDSNQIQMMIDPTKPIANIQQHLEEDTGIPADNQNLSLNGKKELSDPTKTALEYGIEAGSVLDLEHKIMKVEIQIPDSVDDKAVAFQIKPSYRTMSVKEMIAPEVGIPGPQQVLMFNGKEMPNHKSMKELGVKEGSVLQVDRSEEAKQAQAEAAAREAAEAKAKEEKKEKKKKKKEKKEMEYPVHESKDYSHDFTPTPLDLTRFKIWIMVGDQVPFEMVCPIAMDIKTLKEEVMKLRNEAKFVQKYFDGMQDANELKIFPAGSYGEGDPLPDDIPIPKNSDAYKMFYAMR